MMRKLAYLANAAFAVALLVFWITNSGGIQPAGVLKLLLLFALPLINFFALAGSGKEKDVFSLYFEQKKLEQQKRINELKKSMGGDV